MRLARLVVKQCKTFGNASIVGRVLPVPKMVNTHPRREVRVSAGVTGVRNGKVSGRVLTADGIDAHNAFAAPGVVKPRRFAGAELKKGNLDVRLPPKSVVQLRISG